MHMSVLLIYEWFYVGVSLPTILLRALKYKYKAILYTYLHVILVDLIMEFFWNSAE